VTTTPTRYNHMTIRGALFVGRIPSDLPALAAAPLDAVLALWSGLGYYSRARNLQRTAQICVERHSGELPRAIEMKEGVG
jgi:A/G-specific adenine glycosylase